MINTEIVTKTFKGKGSERLQVMTGKQPYQAPPSPRKMSEVSGMGIGAVQ